MAATWSSGNNRSAPDRNALTVKKSRTRRVTWGRNISLEIERTREARAEQPASAHAGRGAERRAAHEGVVIPRSGRARREREARFELQNVASHGLAGEPAVELVSALGAIAGEKLQPRRA